jgi:ornithine cyclodeaminase/alanine dehydrogenase-like protein (mu-crystallin family)
VLIGDLADRVFVAAVGADSPDKRELGPGVLGGAAVVTDVTAQCAAVGELHHAVAEEEMTLADVHGELGQVLTAMVPVPGADRVVYDSTGTGFQDAAACRVVLDRLESS